MLQPTEITVIHDKLVGVSEHPDWPGCLIFQPPDVQAFYNRYHDWVSRYLVLNELYLLGPFAEELERDGWELAFMPSTAAILDDYRRWSIPLHIEGFTCPGDGELFEYQVFTLNKALERAGGTTKTDRLTLFGWGTGTGKSMISAAGAQELFNRGQIDLVIAVTLRHLKRNLCDFFTQYSRVRAMVNDHAVPATRKARYADPDVDCFVMNAEKAFFDYDEILERAQGRRVLYILDEVQKLTTDSTKTRARRSLDSLITKSHAIVWPMSASAVQETPFNYRDVFSLSGGSGVHPLGTKTDFEKRYCLRRREVTIRTRSGGSFAHIFRDWDLARLHEVRHRVAHCAQNVRKTDPVVRDNFKGMQVIVVPVQMSEQDRRLYAMIEAEAARAKSRDESLMPYYRLLRYVCNTPEALHHTTDEFGAQLAAQQPKMCTSTHAAKLEMLLDQCEAIRDAGDKVVVFTQYTNLGLHILSEHMTRRKITHAKHWGVGQTDRQGQQAQHRFKTDHDCPVFLSSDAGAYGLNLQCARYVINYDIPYSYDVLMQRNNRIDRADSYLDGLTSYVFVTDDTVEQRAWEINNSRRQLAEATTGGKEVLSYGDETEPRTLEYLIFGGE